MNLDLAIDVFENAPSNGACADLLCEAGQYCEDGMIGEAEFLGIVRHVAEWLKDDQA